jgi:hypothetical protein
MNRCSLCVEFLEARIVPTHLPVIIENRAYVTALFNDLLGRAPDQVSLNNFTQALDRGVSRDSVALSIINSLEFTRSFIGEQYRHFLGRSASALEIDPWIRFVDGGGNFDQLRANLMSSEEAFVKAGGNNRAWLESVYLKLLGRAIDAEGLRTGLAALSSGTSRFDFAHGIARSVEADRASAREFYLEFLNRRSDPVGLPGWWMALNSGISDQVVLSRFLATEEYGHRAVNEDYVSRLYHDVLGREADPEGLATHVLALASGQSYSDVALAFLTSDEYNRVYVNEQYQRYLGRPAGTQEIDPWVALIQSGASFDVLQAHILSSDEAFQKAGNSNQAWLEYVYQTALDRSADQDGWGKWLADLNGGASRFDVALGIFQSVEADKLTAREFYLDFLKRGPDPEGFPGWWMNLNDGIKQQVVASQFLATPEYVFLVTHTRTN